MQSENLINSSFTTLNKWLKRKTEKGDSETKKDIMFIVLVNTGAGHNAMHAYRGNLWFV